MHAWNSLVVKSQLQRAVATTRTKQARIAKSDVFILLCFDMKDSS